MPAMKALQIGKIDHAHEEFEAIREHAELVHLQDGTREQFLKDCTSGKYDGVKAIARTYMSVELTGRFDKELIDKLPSSVKFISHNGAGYDQIDVEPCTARGIAISNTPQAVDAATADVAMFLLLGALRQAWIPQLALREGRWRGVSTLGKDPENKVLGVLGLGGIGSALAHRATPFGFKVQYHNRNPVTDLEKAFSGSPVPKYVGFGELLSTSDVISIHLPLGPKTRHLIGKKEFDAMKDGVVIVNTARGAVIDEEALVHALDSGKVYSAGLDVFSEEPKVHPGLLKNDKVMLLPHIGTATRETQKKMEVLVIDNVKSALQHDKLVTPVSEQTAPTAKL